MSANRHTNGDLSQTMQPDVELRGDAAYVDRVLREASAKSDRFTHYQRAWLQSLRSGLSKYGDRLPALLDADQWGMIDRAARVTGLRASISGEAG